jgi:complex iron-sulfur molybdoenzyme family reductase subunit gamma
VTWRTAALVLALALAPVRPARGADPLAEAVEVREVAGPIAADAAAPLWDGIPAQVVLAAPQRTIRLHDRAANEALDAARPRAVAVRAAHDQRDLAVALDWNDETEDRPAPGAVEAYGDAAALQLPLRFGAGLRLPHAWATR